MNIETIDREIALLKLEQDMNAYKSQLAECKRRLLEIDRTKLSVINKQKELEQRLLDVEAQYSEV